MVGPLGNLEQRPAANAADHRMIPARQRLGPDQPVVVERILRLEEDLDLVAVDRREQVRFELLVRAARARDIARRPVDPPPRAVAHAGSDLRQAIEHAVGIVVLGHAHQGDARPQPQARPAFGIGDRHGDGIGQRLGQPLPAFAAAFLPRNEEEIAPAKARRGPGAAALEFVAREMPDALRHFDQRPVARRFPEGDIHRIDPPERDHHRVHGAGDRVAGPFSQPALDRLARLGLVRQAG